jgi:glycine/D-amino acid oxidase-like deaminating enzyme
MAPELLGPAKFDLQPELEENAMNNLIARRRVLMGAGALLAAGTLPGCATTGRHAAARSTFPAYVPTMDRIIGITVCSRPFRAAGPRLEVEKIGEQNVVHSYGHGGSGWSLSWGSGEVVTQLAFATGERDIGVVGCGAVGLTAAIQLQRAGAKVTIYARDLPPTVLSAMATGVWSPSSRIGMTESLTPAFKQQWQGMARLSWKMFQNLLGLPGAPVEFFEAYGLRDNLPQPGPAAPHGRADGKPSFAELDRELVPEIGVRSIDVDPAATPFAPRYVRRGSQLMFNLPAYSRMLMADFRAAGGKVVIDELHSPADFARLPHKTVVNATGIGARALMGDDSVVPVRGQLAHMVPQDDVHYGVQYNRVGLTPRRDGFVLQVSGQDDYYGYGIATREPDMAEAELAVKTIASAFKPAA